LGENRRFLLEEISFDGFLRTVRERFNLSTACECRLTYVDSDGDTIALGSDSELQEAVQLEGCTDAPLIRMQLHTTFCKQSDGDEKRPSQAARADAKQDSRTTETKSPPLESDLWPLFNPDQSMGSSCGDDHCGLETMARLDMSQGDAPGDALVTALKSAAVPTEIINRAERALAAMRGPAAELHQALQLAQSSLRTRRKQSETLAATASSRSCDEDSCAVRGEEAMHANHECASNPVAGSNPS